MSTPSVRVPTEENAQTSPRAMALNSASRSSVSAVTVTTRPAPFVLPVRCSVVAAAIVTSGL
jgi:hypothetical protein